MLRGYDRNGIAGQRRDGGEECLQYEPLGIVRLQPRQPRAREPSPRMSASMSEAFTQTCILVPPGTPASCLFVWLD